MHILDLPSELVDHILYFSMFARGVKRGLRLKLVCKTFCAVFNCILFRSGLLDLHPTNMLFEDWHSRKYYCADRLWHDYLVFNCQNMPRPSVRRLAEIRSAAKALDLPKPPVRRFVEIRSVADALLQHFEAQQEKQYRDLNLDTIIDRLCWLGLHGATKHPRIVGFDSERRDVPIQPTPGLNLLSAATYFGCETLVRDLLSQRYNPLNNNDLFPSPMYIAAWTGHANLLQLMQERVPDWEPVNYWPGFRSKLGPGPLEGAAVGGDVNMVRLALYPPSRTIRPPNTNSTNDGGEAGTGETVPNSELVLGEKLGSLDLDYSKLGFYITYVMARTRSPEVYRYLKSFFKQDLIPSMMSDHLAYKAEAGDLVMVRYLLETGADPSPKETGILGPPLIRATDRWHEDVIDLLLEHGADPNERGERTRGTILTAAAKAGSIGLVRKLLNAGVKIDLEKEGWTLLYAIRREHTALAEMMLRMGNTHGRGLRAKIKYAEVQGLESMVELLERWLPGTEPY